MSTAPTSSGQRLLVEILSGHASPWAGEFTKDEITIGRATTCDVRLHPTKDTLCASRIHFRILNSADGITIICDHANGITVDGDKEPQFMEAGARAALTRAGEITIGTDGPRIAIQSLDGQLPGTLKARGTVGRRENVQPVARLPENTATAAHSGRRLGLIGLALVILIAGAGGFFIWNYEGRLTELKKLREAEVDRLIADQQAIRTAISRKPASEALQDALRTAASSVLILGSDRDGAFEPAGTGWVAAEGKLITNAHVGQRLESRRRSGSRIYARRLADNNAEVDIGDVELHPAFLPWLGLLSQASVKSGTGESDANMIAIADLAVITMNADPGKPLTIDDGTDATTVGDPVGYVGYPVEGLAGLPTLQTVTGSITAITDAFFARATNRDGILIHISGIATGGSSGSPILNSRGRVIAVLSAGSVITVEDGSEPKRIPVGLNYGQSALLVRELLDGTAEAAQAKREESWRARMSEVFIAPEQRLEARIAELAKTLHDTPEPISEQDVAITSDTAFRTSIHVDPGFHYVFLAAARDWGDLTLAVGAGGTADDWWKSERAVVTAVLKAAKEARTIDLVINARRQGTSGTAAHLKVMRVKG